MKQTRSRGPALLGPLGALALGLLAGCGEYTSDYRPPQDARARVLWNGNGVFAAVPNGAVSTECLRAMDDAQERPETYFKGYSGYRGGVRVYWGPSVYLGPVVPVPRPIGVSPVRRLATPSTGGSSGGGKGGLFGTGGNSGNGGGGDSGKAIAVVAAVVVLLALPAVTLGLAAGRPEPEKAVAEAIDQVNAYNDLARYPGTPCSALPGDGQ